MQGRTLDDGSAVRPATQHWHMVLVRHQGKSRAIVVGPWTSAGITTWARDAEIVWIRFQVGPSVPYLPIKRLRDAEITLPGTSSRSFWLSGSAWQLPDYDYADVFVERLVRAGLLVREPLVSAAIRDEPETVSPLTLRHRFLQTTGLSHAAILHLERAQRANTLLRQGTSIADTVHETGYFD